MIYVPVGAIDEIPAALGSEVNPGTVGGSTWLLADAPGTAALEMLPSWVRIDGDELWAGGTVPAEELVDEAPAAVSDWMVTAWLPRA